jgi:hypothetical protein
MAVRTEQARPSSRWRTAVIAVVSFLVALALGYAAPLFGLLLSLAGALAAFLRGERAVMVALLMAFAVLLWLVASLFLGPFGSPKGFVGPITTVG